jgi:hypothetical protein
MLASFVPKAGQSDGLLITNWAELHRRKKGPGEAFSSVGRLAGSPLLPVQDIPILHSSIGIPFSFKTVNA